MGQARPGPNADLATSPFEAPRYPTNVLQGSGPQALILPNPRALYPPVCKVYDEPALWEGEELTRTVYETFDGRPRAVNSGQRSVLVCFALQCSKAKQSANQKFPRTLCFDPCSEVTVFQPTHPSRYMGPVSIQSPSAGAISCLVLAWLSEKLTVSVAVQCMSGRVSKQNIALSESGMGSGSCGSFPKRTSWPRHCLSRLYHNNWM